MNVKTLAIGCGLTLALLCGYAPFAAHAQTGGAGQSSTSGGMSGGRQGRGGRTARSQSSGMGAGSRMSGGMMDDSSGFASLYSGLDSMNQQSLQMVFAENRDRVFPNEEDPVRIDPAPWNYPSAAPGAIDTYHFTDYTHDHIAVGSVTDTRMEKKRIMYAYEQMQMRRGMALRQSMMRGTSGSGGMGGSR